MNRAFARRCAWAALAAATAAAVLGTGRPAEATDTDASSSSSAVAELRARITGTANPSARAVLLEKLRTMGTSDARSALEALADHRDDRIAIQAMGAVGRSDHSGARSKLRTIFETTSRSDVARGAAFLAYGRLQRQSGTSWSDLASYASQHCSATSRVGAIVSAAQSSSSSSSESE